MSLDSNLCFSFAVPLFKPVLRCNSHDTIITLLLNWLLVLGTANSLERSLSHNSTGWRSVLPEKVTGPLLVRKFPAFYGSLGFTTSFKSALHLSLSSARSIQFMPPCPASWRFISILPSFTLESRVHITIRALRLVWLYVCFIYEICCSRCGEYIFLISFISNRKALYNGFL